IALESLRTRRFSTRIIPYLFSCLTLGGWYLLFSGWAPQSGRTAHLSMDSGGLHLDHALYFLSCIGAYYVILDALLPGVAYKLDDTRRLVLSVLFGMLFLVATPNGNLVNGEIVPMGYLDKFLRSLLPDRAREVAFAILAMMAVWRLEQLRGGLYLL